MAKLKRSVFGLVIVVLVLGAFVFNLLFEYTLVADIKEVLAGESGSHDDYGAMLFKARGCSGCHTLAHAGSTSTFGPVLDGIGSRLDTASIRESITDPGAQVVLCNNQPCSIEMPEFGAILDDQQIDALVLYLSHQ